MSIQKILTIVCWNLNIWHSAVCRYGYYPRVLPPQLSPRFFFSHYNYMRSLSRLPQGDREGFTEIKAVREKCNADILMCNISSYLHIVYGWVHTRTLHRGGKNHQVLRLQKYTQTARARYSADEKTECLDLPNICVYCHQDLWLSGMLGVVVWQWLESHRTCILLHV